jgi:hypothetical protein
MGEAKNGKVFEKEDHYENSKNINAITHAKELFSFNKICNNRDEWGGVHRHMHTLPGK